MAVDGPNLPIVIQQAGSVSRVQEQTQRLGEQQQMAASAEETERQEKARSQVQQTQASDADNKVRADGRGDNKREQRRKKRRKPSEEPEAEPTVKRPGGDLVDVTV